MKKEQIMRDVIDRQQNEIERLKKELLEAHQTIDNCDIILQQNHELQSKNEELISRARPTEGNICDAILDAHKRNKPSYGASLSTEIALIIAKEIYNLIPPKEADRE